MKKKKKESETNSSFVDWTWKSCQSFFKKISPKSSLQEHKWLLSRAILPSDWLEQLEVCVVFHYFIHIATSRYWLMSSAWWFRNKSGEIFIVFVLHDVFGINDHITLIYHWVRISDNENGYFFQKPFNLFSYSWYFLTKNDVNSSQKNISCNQTHLLEQVAQHLPINKW